MLLMNKTLLKLARGLWLWIFAIAGMGFLTLTGTTALAEIIAGFLGTLFQPQEILHTAWGAVSAALAAAVFTFLAQLLKGLLEYRTAAKAREDMRKMIFSKVLELDAGGIEKIGPVSAITASVDAVEQMQTYFSTYLPSLIYSIIAPVYLFFHLKGISMPVAVLLLVVSLFLLPINNAFRSRIEDIRKIYWRSLDDMTGYYMDSLRGYAGDYAGEFLDQATKNQKKSEILQKALPETAGYAIMDLFFPLAFVSGGQGLLSILQMRWMP